MLTRPPYNSSETATKSGENPGISTKISTVVENGLDKNPQGP